MATADAHRHVQQLVSAEALAHWVDCGLQSLAAESIRLAAADFDLHLHPCETVELTFAYIGDFGEVVTQHLRDCHFHIPPLSCCHQTCAVADLAAPKGVEA
jgi:hypothetical protein